MTTCSSLLTLALLLPSAHGFLTADTRNGKLPHAITPARTAASQSNACPSIDQHKRPPPQLDTSSFSTTFDAADDTAAVDTYTPPNLSGKVAIVTGASRGIGKGIALELGKAGMKVYVTGRSSRATGVSTERDLGPANTDATVDRTAEEINELPGSGEGIAVQMDVSNDEEVAALVAKVQSEQGRLDAVVCSAFTTPPELNDASFRDDFWKQGAEMWDACHGVGLRGAYMTCCESVPLMIDTAEQNKDSRPLLVIISSFGGKSYTFNVAYGVGKAGADRLASDMAIQLEKHNIDTVALYPGVVRTEGNVEMDRRGEWDKASGGLDLSMGESPQFSGRAVATLLADPASMKEQSGDVVVVAEMAQERGFTDIDGTNPPSIRNLRFILPSFVFPQIEKESGATLPSWIKDNVPDFLLPWSIFTSGPPPTAD